MACELNNHLGNGSTLFQLACQQSNESKWFPFQSVYSVRVASNVIERMFVMLSHSIWMQLKCLSICIENHEKD